MFAVYWHKYPAAHIAYLLVSQLDFKLVKGFRFYTIIVLIIVFFYLTKIALLKQCDCPALTR